MGGARELMGKAPPQRTFLLLSVCSVIITIIDHPDHGRHVLWLDD
jgi:hypothetical protein